MHEMGRSFAWGAALALFTWFGCGPSNTFVATLNGANETPAVTTSATGTATLTRDGDTMNYTITASGLSTNATAAHLHAGARGVIGPPVVPFTVTPSTSQDLRGSFTATNITNPNNPPITTMDALVEQIRAGNMYVNIHTSQNTSGEIRGQLAAQ